MSTNYKGDKNKLVSSDYLYNQLKNLDNRHNDKLHDTLYVEKTETIIDTPAYYSVCQSTDDGALNVVTVVTDSSTQIALDDIKVQTTPEDLSALTGDGTEYVKYIAEVNHEETYDEEKYMLKDNTYDKETIDNKIVQASTGLETMTTDEWNTYFGSLIITAKDGGN